MSWNSSLRRRQSKPRSSGLRLLLAAIAFWVQILAGGTAMPHAMPDDLDEAIAASICHADPTDAITPSAPRHDQSKDCALCPICQIAAQVQLVLPPEFPVLPAPDALTSAEFVASPPASRVPHAASPARARGPPITA